MIENDRQDFNCLQVPGNGVGLNSIAVCVEKREAQYEVRPGRGKNGVNRSGATLQSSGMPGTAQPISVLIVADHDVAREDLQALLKRTNGVVVVGGVGTGREAGEAVRQLTPMVVLIQLHLLDGIGIRVCREIREIDPACKVVMVFTSSADEESAAAIVRDGVTAYLLKDVISEGSVCVIERVAAGQSVLDPVFAAQVVAFLRSSDVSADLNLDQSLSPHEQQMMTLVAERKTNKEIGAVLGLSEKTIRNSLTAVFKKLGATRRSQAAAIYGRQHPSSTFS